MRNAKGNTVVHGWLQNAEGKKIDEVLVALYRAPQSYTGEESADISCHGGIAVIQAVMKLLGEAGFREALPGEFTFRSFMNGKLDLTKAESVMELVSARSGRGREQAVSRLSGTLEKEIREITSSLTEILAETEIHLDYSEEDGIETEEDGGLPGMEKISGVLERLKTLADSYSLERLFREGALTVIAGRPNAGKSSLFNLLLKEDRSLVTEIPGTTRDWIEAWVTVGDIPLRLIDTAGLRESNDRIEKLGVGRSRELLAGADLILYLVDGTKGIANEDRDFFRGEINAPVIVVWNKADIQPLDHSLPELSTKKIVECSAKTGAGLSALINAITETLETAAGSGEKTYTNAGTAVSSTGIGTARQKELVETAITNLETVLSLANAREALDLIAPPLRDCINALAEITGEVSTADILETMFSRFCVGK
ncbi:tRNA modification GTPase MnmE [Spirochaetia bacterium]|nr:tRNA modification GTPase MnmE [Spirochaetia bacterium]